MHIFMFYGSGLNARFTLLAGGTFDLNILTGKKQQRNKSSSKINISIERQSETFTTIQSSILRVNTNPRFNSLVDCEEMRNALPSSRPPTPSYSWSSSRKVSSKMLTKGIELWKSCPFSSLLPRCTEFSSSSSIGMNSVEENLPSWD